MRAMITIARDADQDRPISLEKVANSTEISRRYLEQLVIALKGAALIRSVSGRRGGYFLQKPAGEIKIGEVIEAAIGTINVVDCVDLPEMCMKSDACECRLIYRLINKRIREVLNELTLADLSDSARLSAVALEVGDDLSALDWEAIGTSAADLDCRS